MTEKKSVWKRDADDVLVPLEQRFLRWVFASWWHHALLAFVGIGSVALTVWLAISN